MLNGNAVQLPKNKEALAKIIDQHAEREEARLQYRHTMWLLSWYYLNGARRFDVFDPEIGRLQPHFLDEEGNMEFQSQELLSAIDRVSSRLASMDLMPRVSREGMSLAGIRERSVAQILLDSLVSKNQVNQVATKFAHLLTTLGSCGIAGHVVDGQTVGMVADLEVVHPREIFPFPSLGSDYTKTSGIMRQRTVPISYLKEVFGKKVLSNLDSMDYWEQTAGEHLTDGSELEGGINYNDGSGPGNASSKNKEIIGVVKIRELWTFGTGELVDRYVVTSGDYVISDQSFEGLEVYCPIGFSRFMENGTFHGAGLFDLLFSISREMEKLLKSLFNNVRDIDRYGVLVMPQGQFNERALLRDVGKGLRVMPFEPDPVSENFKPFSINPQTAGDIPGKTAAYAKELLDGINPVRDLISEKGRVDSAAGLNFLDEETNKTMTTPTRAMENAFGQCYRALLSAASKIVSMSPRAIPVSYLTLDLAGARIDPEQGTVSFENNNPIPSLTNLHFSVRQLNPKSNVARKQEAMEMLKAGLTDPDGLKLFSLKEGLDFALWLDEEKSAYEAVVRNCLLLYGDGESPGEVVLTPHTARPDFQMRVLTSFLTSPTMSMASPQVQDEFMKYRQFMMDALGFTLPEAVPNPDDMSILLDSQRQAGDLMGKAQMRADEITQKSKMQRNQGGGQGGPPQTPPGPQGPQSPLPFEPQGVAQ